jgi:hypothetical protein
MVPLGVIAFEPGIYLVSQARCEALREAQRRRLAAEELEEERPLWKRQWRYNFALTMTQLPRA